MPTDWKAELGNDKVPQRTWLEMPAIGMESEFNVWVDGEEVVPEKYWSHPSEFMDRELLPRTEKSLQLPTGGAVYFDRGVIEVVTPVIEIAPGCTARVVRNLWEQIGFVRAQLTRWEQLTNHQVQLKAYSAHYNISFELAESEQNKRRNIHKLALLLAYILPVPVALVGGNRRSTGVGVRPRGNRIEVTVDFTPDPGLMIATATLIVPIVREIMSWPAYDLSLLDELPIPTVAEVIPGKHTTRKGWLTKDFHFPRSPFTADVDAPVWTVRDGRLLSLRAMALETCWFFRHEIRRVSDPFSFRLLFAVLSGKAPSMLDLEDRPAAYDDVGRLCQWGMVIAELKNYDRGSHRATAAEADSPRPIDRYVRMRHRERIHQVAASAAATPARPVRAKGSEASRTEPVRQAPAPFRPSAVVPIRRRRAPVSGAVVTQQREATGARPQKREYLNRRTGKAPGNGGERRTRDRRQGDYSVPFPDRRLTRSAYEQVFLKLVSGGRLKIGEAVYRPVGMKGWYHAIFRRVSDGKEMLLTIDQLLARMRDWQR
jgi:hypothetical protein